MSACSRTCRIPLFILVLVAAAFSSPRLATCSAQETTPPAKPAADAKAITGDDDEPKVLPAPKLPDPPDAKRLPEPDFVWVDAKHREVLVDGYVSLREGYLEMFACEVNTKEHESIIAVRTRAATVHAALLSVGAVPGHPVQYNPKFAPPAGTEIGVEVRWLDPQGKWQSARAQDWITNSKTKKPMTETWVFAGSGFWKDEQTGKQYYMAEAGDFICVSNFTTAMLDVPVESSQSNDELVYEANPDRVPSLGTPVRLVLTPKLEKDKAGADAPKGAK